MTASSKPGPDDPDALSPWERRVLAGIEHDLAASDPRLVRELTGWRAAATPRWSPVSAPTIGILCLGLFVLILAGAVLPASWWPVLGVVTALVVIPWLLMAASETNRRG